MVTSASGRLEVALDATPLLGPRTGVGEFCAGALTALAKLPGLEVTAFAVTWRRRGLVASEVPEGVRVASRPLPARPLQWAWRRGDLPPIESFTGAMDVVHGTNFVVPPARRAARVVTVHDLTTVRFPELCQASTLQFPSLVRRAAGTGAFVHVPSRFVGEEVVELLGVSPERVRVVHHGVPTQLPAACPAAARPSGLSVRLPEWVERYVLAIGTVEPRKDLPTLVRAFAQLASASPGLALVLAGPDGWGSDALAASIAETSLSDRVVRLGWVERAERRQLLEGACVFAYPSVYEGFGFPPLEAMLAGVPVVATRAGALDEVAGGGAVLVDVGDPSALAEAIARLVDDPAARAAQVARGRSWVCRYSWEACAEGLASVYQAAADAR